MSLNSYQNTTTEVELAEFDGIEISQLALSIIAGNPDQSEAIVPVSAKFGSSRRTILIDRQPQLDRPLVSFNPLYEPADVFADDG